MREKNIGFLAQHSKIMSSFAANLMHNYDEEQHIRFPAAFSPCDTALAGDR